MALYFSSSSLKSSTSLSYSSSSWCFFCLLSFQALIDIFLKPACFRSSSCCSSSSRFLLYYEYSSSKYSSRLTFYSITGIVLLSTVITSAGLESLILSARSYSFSGTSPYYLAATTLPPFEGMFFRNFSKNLVLKRSASFSDFSFALVKCSLLYKICLMTPLYRLICTFASLFLSFLLCCWAMLLALPSTVFL